MVAGHGHISLVTRYRDEVLADLQRSAGQSEGDEGIPALLLIPHPSRDNTR